MKLYNGCSKLVTQCLQKLLILQLHTPQEEVDDSPGYAEY